MGKGCPGRKNKNEDIDDLKPAHLVHKISFFYFFPRMRL